MKFITQSPKKALKAFLKQRPSESERDKFKNNLIALLDKIGVIEKQPKDESEEHLKNNLRDFLRDTFYIDSNAINTKDKKDLVIHIGKSTDTDVAVIIEAKRPSNKNEMVSAENANKKALHELILYYLTERNAKENVQLKQLVVTDIHQWFIIDANYFDKHIYRNTQIRKLYETKVNDKKDNPWFYEEIAKILSKIDVEIPCVYFDIRDYEKILRNTKTDDDKELVALYKILSPQHLLKIASPNDSNTLNERFYKELLHIIGLEEAREQYFFEGEKIMVTRKCPKEPIFTYTGFDCFVSQTFFVIQSERINLKYLTGLLNSKLVAFWLRKKGKMQGNAYQLDKEPLLEIPIYKPADKDVNEIAKLVDKIILLKQQGKDSSEQENKIDELVYKLYDITEDEQKIIVKN